METVVADLRIGQRHARALGIGRTHVLADVAHLRGVAAVGLQVRREVDHGLMVSPLGGGQQPLVGDVALPTAQAGLVDAEDFRRARVVPRTGLFHEKGDTPRQLFVRAAQQCGRLAHQQLTALRQRKSLDQCGKARAFARPGHAELSGLAAAATGHTGHIGVKPRLRTGSRCGQDRRKRSWTRLAQHPASEVRSAIAGKESLPLNVLVAFVDDASIEVVRQLANNRLALKLFELPLLQKMINRDVSVADDIADNLHRVSKLVRVGVIQALLQYTDPKVVEKAENFACDEDEFDWDKRDEDECDQDKE